MSQDYVQNSPICFLQKTTDALDGTVVGYATAAYSVGGVVGVFRALAPGVHGANTISFIDTGVATTLYIVNQAGNMLVYLGRTGIAITSKLSDVAAALTAFKDVSGNASPILLGVTTDGTITAALSPTALTGGVLPILKNSILRFDIGSAHGGLLYFDSRYPVVVESMEIVAGAGTAKIEIVTVNDGLVTSEPVDITGQFNISNTKYSTLLGKPLLLGANQALKVTGVTADAANMIRAWVRLAGSSL